ncbi:MAG: RICIN domain-containing protein, partial [Bacteroidota bacterium]
SVCEGDSLVLGMGPDKGLAYTWSGPLIGSVADSTLKLGSAHEGMAGMYTATFVNEFGCTIRKDIQLQVKHTPNIQFIKRDPVCADNQGGVFTFQFPDDPAYSGLEFSVNGDAGPYQATSDQVGFFSITDLAVGTYDLWARWNNNECPVALGVQELACEASFVPLQNDAYLITAKISNKVVDIESWAGGDSANVVQQTRDSLTNQGWNLVRQTGNQFRLGMDMNSLVLNVEGNGVDPGANVNQSPWLDEDHQRWELQHAGNDWYFLQSVGNELYLTVANEDTSAGANLQVEAFNGSDAQQFRFTPFYFTPLPIFDLPAFIEVEVSDSDGQAELSWSFINPTPITRFEVEKSFDSLTFTKLLEIPAQVDTADVQLYSALDEEPGAETVFYRVVAVWENNNRQVSQVVRFDTDAVGGELVLFPNPVSKGETLQVKVSMLGESEVTVMIMEMAGRVIYQEEISLDVGMGEWNIELPSGLPAGTYYFSILGEEQRLGRLFEYK